MPQLINTKTANTANRAKWSAPTLRRLNADKAQGTGGFTNDSNQS